MFWGMERRRAMGSLPGCKLLAEALEREEIPIYLAEPMVGAGVSAISRLIAGDRGPSLALAVRIRDRWGVPVEAWIEGYKKPKAR